MINGRDWASYQGAAPDVSGLDFVFIKVTQGLGYINPYWQQQLHVATQAGLVVGLYHYPDMRNGAGVECEHFCTVAANALSGGPVMAMLDWEGYDPTNQGLSHADQAAYKDAFLEHLALLRPRNRSVLYANLDYWRDVDTSGRYGDALFIAAPGTPGHPGIATPWLFHQYGENKGVDLDVANFPSRPALQAWASKQEDDLTPEEHQMLADVHAALPALQYMGWGFRNKDEDAAAEAATHSHSLDAWGKLSQTYEGVGELVKALPQGGPTAAELQAAAQAGAEAGATAAIAKFLASITPKAA